MAAAREAIDLLLYEKAIAYFVREPFPNITTGTDLRSGKIDTKALEITSCINDGSVIFADGIEQDFLPFDWARLSRSSLQAKRST
ncbi:hypothetical protein [Erythrobacter ani]|uniref:Uncharacterized protein n=1 Tax=Erythrobacter ani TaxID=2827235 RepID=A0ABS6SM58_9SPHN|nr:hypothetical protein [Erythrobacter ani]MBV7266069.1 hypothetical protein [Erythrobacter ani]